MAWLETTYICNYCALSKYREITRGSNTIQEGQNSAGYIGRGNVIYNKTTCPSDGGQFVSRINILCYMANPPGVYVLTLDWKQKAWSKEYRQCSVPHDGVDFRIAFFFFVCVYIQRVKIVLNKSWYFLVNIFLKELLTWNWRRFWSKPQTIQTLISEITFCVITQGEGNELLKSI